MARVSDQDIVNQLDTFHQDPYLLDLRDARALLREVDDAMRHNIYPNELYDRIRQHLEGHDE